MNEIFSECALWLEIRINRDLNKLIPRIKINVRIDNFNATISDEITSFGDLTNNIYDII